MENRKERRARERREAKAEAKRRKASAREERPAAAYVTTLDLTGLPPEMGAVLQSMQQHQPMLITAGMVGISPLVEIQRRDLLVEIDVQEALVRIADIHAKWDIASTTHGDLEPLHQELLAAATAEWVPAVRSEISRGNIFAAPHVTVGLLRELMGTSSTASRPLTSNELVLLLISIATEQESLSDFESDTPTSAEISALDAHQQAMSPQDLIALAHEELQILNANGLFNMPQKIECLKADAFDFWFSPWADRAHSSLGSTPAETFAAATGIDLELFLRAGVTIAEAVEAGRVVVSVDDLSGNERMRDFVVENMALDLAGFREQIEADRGRGDVKFQRYTFTRYPFLKLGGGELLILRAQWATERFFGDPAQLDVIAAFANSDKGRAQRFKEGVKYQFEDVIGRTLARIAARSGRVQELITEGEMEARWTEKKGKKPSVCDWALLVSPGPMTILVDATHHPLNATLAQGLGDGEMYDVDAGKILTDGKFQQFSSVMRLVNRLGFSGEPQPDMAFMPFVVVPNSGVLGSMMIELDYRNRAATVFAEFQGRVAPPTVLPLRDLQLLEGIGDFLHGDVMTFLWAWRKFPVPLSLQEYLDVTGAPRPVPKHTFEAAKQLDRRIGRDG